MNFDLAIDNTWKQINIQIKTSTYFYATSNLLILKYNT